MTIKTFGIGCGTLLLLLLGYGVFRLTHLWEYESVGPYAVRRNTLTGIVEIDTGGGSYARSFENNQYADPIPPEDLKRLKIEAPAWDPVGVLCGRATVAPGKPIKGRMALEITILDTKLHKRLRDRSMRITMDWPAGASTPFALRTNMTPPQNTNEQAILTPQPTLYSGESSAPEGVP